MKLITAPPSPAGDAPVRQRQFVRHADTVDLHRLLADETARMADLRLQAANRRRAAGSGHLHDGRSQLRHGARQLHLNEHVPGDGQSPESAPAACHRACWRTRGVSCSTASMVPTVRQSAATRNMVPSSASCASGAQQRPAAPRRVRITSAHRSSAIPAWPSSAGPRVCSTTKRDRSPRCPGAFGTG